MCTFGRGFVCRGSDAVQSAVHSAVKASGRAEFSHLNSGAAFDPRPLSSGVIELGAVASRSRCARCAGRGCRLAIFVCAARRGGGLGGSAG